MATTFASFDFVPRRGAPDWRAVSSVDPARFLRGDVAPEELAHLSQLAAHLRGCALEPDARLSDGANAARFARAAALLSLTAELDGAAAAEDLRDAYDNLDALRAENEALRVRAARRNWAMRPCARSSEGFDLV